MGYSKTKLKIAIITHTKLKVAIIIIIKNHPFRQKFNVQTPVLNALVNHIMLSAKLIATKFNVKT